MIELMTGRRPDPQGYYMVLMPKEGLGELYELIRRYEGLGVIVEDWGEHVVLKSRSRSILKTFLKEAKMKGAVIKSEI